MKYEVADSKIIRVTSAGRVMPVANGATTITARYGDKSATMTVKAESMDTTIPISFANHIVPIFTKVGCNGGGCHGKSGFGGQNDAPVPARLCPGVRLPDSRQGKPRSPAVAVLSGK